MNVSSISDNILKIILYYNIFHYPLTLEEIYAFYPSREITREQLEKVLDSLVAGHESLLGTHKGYYFTAPNMHYIEERLKKEKTSSKHWKIARMMTMLIKTVPFVRGVLVTGSLSKNSSDESSDIDFLIICKENRLWITRTVLRLLTRVFQLYREKLFCPNYFLTENCLIIEDRNFFTATELAHVKVMYNTSLLDKLVQSNKWVEEYFPNYSKSYFTQHISPFRTSDKPSAIQSLIELFFHGKLGDWIDDSLLRTMRRRLNNKFADFAAREKNKCFRISKNSAKVHGLPIDHRKVILHKHETLFNQYNLLKRTN